MPNFEEHCESTYRKLGCRFERVHKWMDSPSEYMGTRHRLRRHDPYKTPETATELFRKYYPNHAHLIEEAVLNHIELDRASGDFTYSEAEKALEELDELDEKQARRESARREKRLKALKASPIWLGLSIGSIAATYFSYFSYRGDPTNTTFSFMVIVFPLTSLLTLWMTFSCIAEVIGYHPLYFNILTFSEVFVVLLNVSFYNERSSYWLAIIWTGIYLAALIGPMALGRNFDKDHARVMAQYRQNLESQRRTELGITESEEEEDFLSEENLEAQGTPSSAEMDSEDIEESWH